MSVSTQIKKLVIRMLNGDETAKQKLIDYYSKVVTNLVETKYMDTNCDKNLLIQAGIQGVEDATKKYNINFKSNFSTYVKTSIHGSIIKEINKNNKNDRGKIKNWSNKLYLKDKDSYKGIIDYYSKSIISLIETKYNNTTYSKDDLIQAGFLGLITAVNNYKQNQQSYFSEYANTCIHNEIIREINKENQNLNLIYTGLNNNSNKNEYFDFIEDIENKELIYKAISLLPDRNQEILYLYIIKDYKSEDIAKIYKLSRQRVEQITKRSLEMIRNYIAYGKIKIKKNSQI